MYKFTRSLSSNKNFHLNPLQQPQTLQNQSDSQKQLNCILIGKSNKQKKNIAQINNSKETTNLKANNNSHFQLAIDKLDCLNFNLKSRSKNQFQSLHYNSSATSPKSPSLFQRKKHFSNGLLSRQSNLVASKPSNKNQENGQNKNFLSKLQQKNSIYNMAKFQKQQNSKKLCLAPKNSYLNIKQQKNDFQEENFSHIDQKVNHLLKTLSKKSSKNDNFTDIKSHANEYTPNFKIKNQQKQQMSSTNSPLSHEQLLQLRTLLAKNKFKTQQKQQKQEINSCKIQQEKNIQQLKFIKQCQMIYHIQPNIFDQKSLISNEYSKQKKVKNETQQEIVSKVFEKINKRDQIYQILLKQNLVNKGSTFNSEQTQKKNCRNSKQNHFNDQLSKIEWMYNQSELMEDIIQQFIKVSNIPQFSSKSKNKAENQQNQKQFQEQINQRVKYHQLERFTKIYDFLSSFQQQNQI